MNAPETPRFPLFALGRHRLGSDGAGVTTLAAARGCPLRCKYCLNPQSLRAETPARMVSPAQLYEMTRVDDLYFQATGGGVTFGGGEPLLYAPFIAAFREICGAAWRLRAETSLNLPEEAARLALSCLDEAIVDIKDANPRIYRAYTGKGRVHLPHSQRGEFTPVKCAASPAGISASAHLSNRLRRESAKRHGNWRSP